MSDEVGDEVGEGPDAGGLGSVGEEAAKLLGALAGWARDTDLGGAVGAVSAVGAALGEVDEHVATGAPECRYCPVCRTVHVVRELSPEVRAHLTSAASSLLQAATEALASLPQPGRDRPAPPGGATGFERIDLDDPHDDGGAT